MIKSSLDKAAKLEAKARQIREEAAEEERREKASKQKLFEKRTKIEAYRSDYYAGVSVGKLNFYYGYEEKWCRKHGKNPNCADDYDCELDEDCFVVTKGDKEIMRIPDSKLGPEVLDVAHGLLLGIAHFIRTLKI